MLRILWMAVIDVPNEPAVLSRLLARVLGWAGASPECRVEGLPNAGECLRLGLMRWHFNP